MKANSHKKEMHAPKVFDKPTLVNILNPRMMPRAFFGPAYASILCLMAFFLFCTVALASTPTLSSLLRPSASTKGMGLAAATFHLSSGDATEIETASLTYLTSNDCSSGPFLPAFSTSGSSGPLTIPGSGNISLDAASVYQVAINSTPGTISNVNSVLVGLGNTNGTFATFTGSCAAAGGYCCLPITCSSGAGTCVASVGTQNFTLNQAASAASISTSSPLLIQPSATGSLVITNSGPSTATNIVATLPASLNDITQNSSNCTSVASGATCQLSFTASTALHDPTLISIQGDNTNSVFATLSVAVPWVVNGTVSAIVQDPVYHLTYIGGNFTAVGPRTGTGVPIDTTSAQPLTTFPQVNGTVNAVIADGNGGWYIGGTFTSVGGVTRNNIAHISSDYTVDSTFALLHNKCYPK